MVPDGVQQVRLAQADPAKQEERVEGLARILRHSDGGAVGELVVVAHDKRRERVGGIELGLTGPGCRRGFRRLFGQHDRLGLRRGSGGNRRLRRGDHEGDVHRLHRRPADHRAQQVKVVVLEPHFAKLIRDRQREGFALELVRLDGRKPERIDLGFQHPAQGILSGSPEGLSGNGHVGFGS